MVNMLQGSSLNTQRISVFGGKATYPGSSYSVAIFLVEPDSFKRVFLSKAPGVREVPGSRTAQQVNIHTTTSGVFYGSSFELPEDSTVLLQMSSTSRGVRIADAAILVNLRAQGPLLSIRALIDVPAATGNTPLDTPVFVGAGDIMDPRLFRDIHGVSIPKNYVTAYMDMDEVNECFSVETLLQERAPAPVVQTVVNSSGVAVKLRVTKPVRRMRIRKP